MSIDVGFDFENKKSYVQSSCSKELNMSSDEEKVLSIFYNLLFSDVDTTKIRLERRSGSYLSVF